MTSLIDKAAPCPCQEKIISTYYTFRQTGNENLNNTGTGSCYQEWFPNEDGVKQMCCYRMDGTLRTGSNNGGYIVPNNTPYNITDVHSNCCRGDHVLCEQFYEMIPSDDCSRYTTPVSARSYGDPTITTLDGHSYSFNGHGEYVFLKTNDIEIQARTEYVTKGNKDATMFTAFVFHINKKNISIEAHLNLSTKAIQVYNNGILLCNSSKTPNGPCTMPPAPIGGCLMIFAGDNTIGISGCGINTFTKSITLTAGEMMDITFDGIKTEKLDNTTQGLAGVTANNYYISRNDSKTPVNASASHIFDFGETWALQNSSESLFDYSLTGGHIYSTYNLNHTRPRFLEDLVGNLTALFKNFTEANITKFDATCRNYWDNESNTECLLAIARNHDYNFGVNVMKIANETRRLYEITHNTPPFFYKNMSDISVIDVIPNSNKTSITIDLSKYASDNESKSGLRFIIDSEIPASDYSISAEGVFNWNFTDELRNITLTKLKINVYDTYNKSAQYNMFVRYCGCEHGMAECTDFPEADTNSTKHIITATCYCEKGYEGTYCENRMDPCLKTKCYEDRCNSSASVGENPCLPCPHGYEGDGTICSDIDECDPSYEDIDKCDQMCSNTEGSFNCSCKNGYRLNNNNHTCDDIDECKEGTKICSEIHHEVCVNNIGNAVCNCMPNYLRKTEKGSCEEIGDAAMFVGTISIQITITKYTNDINKTVDTEENRKQMEVTLDERFKGTPGYLGVEVFKLSVVITNSPTGRKKREVKSGKLDVDYLVKWRNISYGTENVFKDLEGSSSRYNANHTTEEKPFGLADVVTLNLKTIRLEPNNVLCSNNSPTVPTTQTKSTKSTTAATIAPNITSRPTTTTTSTITPNSSTTTTTTTAPNSSSTTTTITTAPNSSTTTTTTTTTPNSTVTTTTAITTSSKSTTTTTTTTSNATTTTTTTITTNSSIGPS
ncbi:Fibrillin-2 [Mactra antiquata]